MARPKKQPEIDEISDNPMPLKVRGILKEIIRHPERARALAEEALKHI